MTLRRLLPILVLAVAAAFAAPGAASAATPCWKQVINDWLADGRIDRIYEDSCYAKALDELPQDLEEYSSLADEIQVAREAAASGDPAPDLPGGPGDLEGGGGDGDGEGSDERAAPGTPFSSDGDDDDRGPLEELLVKIGPRNADDVPLPLLILGGIATLLIATGAAGMVARRTAGRRIQSPPQP